MADMLNVALSGLSAFKSAITAVGHNITNVNTPGYNRQEINFATRKSVAYSSFSLGSGVSIDSINRVRSDFVDKQLQRSESLFSQYESYSQQAARLDTLFSESGVNLTQGMQNFFAALNQISEKPDEITTRQVFLSQAEVLVSQFSQVQDQLEEQQNFLYSDMESAAHSANSILQELANINEQVINTISAPLDLLDRRDYLVNELSQYMSVTTLEQDNGAINVSLSEGQALLVNTEVNALSVSRNPENGDLIDLFTTANGTPVRITDRISGGKLGGLVSFNKEILTNANASISLVALGLSEGFNAQHKLGIDLNSNLGTNFFADLNTTYLQANRATAEVDNAGDAKLNISVSDVNSLTASSYSLAMTAPGSYTVNRLSDNTATTFNSFPQTIDGFTISIASGTMAVGDDYLITPTAGAARAMDVLIKQPEQLAMAAPIRSISNTNNLGSAVMSQGHVLSTSTSMFTTTPGQLSPPLRIEFLSSTTYQLVNDTTDAVIEGALVYDPLNGTEIFPTAGAYDPGFRFNIVGEAQTGDKFNIEFNSGGLGDNRNGLELADLGSKKVMNNGSVSYQDIYSGLVGDIGLRANSAYINLESSTALLAQAQNQRDSISGVNLDEEAANLLRLEQAYQAAGQMVSVANRLFQTLFNSLYG